MKKIRIGCGCGCSFDRIEPAVELVEKGNLDYIVFEALAERTIANDIKRKRENPDVGYTPMLEERMENILPLLKEKNTKLITNMGSSNVEGAVNATIKVCKKLRIDSLKIAYVTGDEISENLDDYSDYQLIDEQVEIKNFNNEIISANVYFGYESIVEALEEGADVVITGRIADASLFIAPIIYEYGFSEELYAQATLMGHLLECAGQVTGGYFSDPGYKDVDGLANLGFPFAEISADGDFIVSKVKGSGGRVSTETVSEQILYEIKNPSEYITPNGVVSFNDVILEETSEDEVLVKGAKYVAPVETYKINLGFEDGHYGVGEVSFGGKNSLALAKLCEEIIEKRWEVTGYRPEEYKFSFIGFNSLYGNEISNQIMDQSFSEIRLRLVVKSKSQQVVKNAIREVDFMYTNGPAGSAGIRTSVKSGVGVDSLILPKENISYNVSYKEI